MLDFDARAKAEPGENFKILIDFRLLSGESTLRCVWRADSIDNVKAWILYTSDGADELTPDEMWTCL